MQLSERKEHPTLKFPIQAHSAAMIMDTCALLDFSSFLFMLNSEFHTNSTFGNSIFHTMDLMFHNVERKKLHTSSTQNALSMFYYDHRDSTQFPHFFHILVPHCYHTNSTFSLSSIKWKREKIVELDFHSFSIVFPQFIHTLNTLWNTLVFSSESHLGWKPLTKGLGFFESGKIKSVRIRTLLIPQLSQNLARY